MDKIFINNITNPYDFEELIKVFLSPTNYELTENREDADIVFNEAESDDKNEIKREIYLYFAEKTGQYPAWGILTGVRPVKLTGELMDQFNEEVANGENKFYDVDLAELTKKKLMSTYLVSKPKADLLLETYLYQQESVGKPPKDSVGLYIGIPFCPTRCLYCSFTSNQKPMCEIIRYLEALKTEIEFVGRRIKETGLSVESVYIGGGTPTTLTAEQLDDLLTFVERNIPLENSKEFTVEAGRPDTITAEKLAVIKAHGIERISINPQSMKERTLVLIGRSHKPDDILDAFKLADEAGINIVNCDLITGLPEETPDDFESTLDTVLALNPKNITVHTLAVKRASRLIEEDPEYHYRQAETVREMLAIADVKLRRNGYRPYYLYRQKHMAGSFENVGWCKENSPSVYNIRIMEEKQHILALGAGGISKIYFPEENRLERVPNVSNYEVYIDRLDEMLERKEKGFFSLIIHNN